MRLLCLILLLSVVGSCATKPSRRPMIPLVIVGSDGSWSGTIRHSGLRVSGPINLTQPKPLVLGEGVGTVLLNTSTLEGHWVSFWIEPGVCEARGRSYPYRVQAGGYRSCITDPPRSRDAAGVDALNAQCGKAPRFRLQGCAAHERSRSRRR